MCSERVSSFLVYDSILIKIVIIDSFHRQKNIFALKCGSEFCRSFNELEVATVNKLQPGLKAFKVNYGTFCCLHTVLPYRSCI